MINTLDKHKPHFIINLKTNQHPIINREPSLMLVRFSLPAGTGITLFEHDAKTLLQLIRHSGTIPGAIDADDVAQGLQNLKVALANPSKKSPTTKASGYNDDEYEETPSPSARFYPFIQLCEQAIKQHKNLMWDYDHSVF